MLRVLAHYYIMVLSPNEGLHQLAIRIKYPDPRKNKMKKKTPDIATEW